MLGRSPTPELHLFQTEGMGKDLSEKSPGLVSEGLTRDLRMSLRWLFFEGLRHLREEGLCGLPQERLCRIFSEGLCPLLSRGLQGLLLERL